VSTTACHAANEGRWERAEGWADVLCCFVLWLGFGCTALTVQDGWKYGISVVECTDPTTFLRAVRAPSSRGTSHVACCTAAGARRSCALPCTLPHAPVSLLASIVVIDYEDRRYRHYHSDGLQTSTLLRAAQSSQHYLP
jgi:hypothetical protein